VQRNLDYYRISEAIPALIAVYNILTGEYLYVNNTVKKILGYAPADFITGGLPFFSSLIHPDDFPRIIAENNSSLKLANSKKHTQDTEPIITFEYRVRHKNGTYRWLHTDGSVFCRGKNGNVECVLNASLDITNRKDHLLSITSHELKTPLTSMKIYLEVLQTQLAKGDIQKASSLTNKIQEQTNKLKALVNDLLDVSRIENGKLYLHRESFSLNELVQETIETVQTTTSRHAIIFQNTPSIMLHADRFRLYQVLVNLLINAIKYSPKGGDIIVLLKKNHTHALISIQDFGIGIAKKHLKNIFEKLYQTPESTEKTFPGLGMGLYISREIIKRHNGKVWVESTEGKGSIFYTSLPLREITNISA